MNHKYQNYPAMTTHSGIVIFNALLGTVRWRGGGGWRGGLG